MNKLVKTAIEQICVMLKQESTWRGLITIVTAAGVTIEPELATHIIAVGLALVGMINIGKKD